MKDSGCLARASLRAELHLACVSGPDAGIVLPPGPLGRACTIPLSCARLAREHATFAVTRGRAHVQRTPEACPTRVYSPLLGWRSPRVERPLRAGRRIRMGSDVFEVRPRPRRLSWPSAAPAGKATVSGRTLVRGVPLLSVLSLVIFAGWRLRAGASRSLVLLPLTVIVLAVAILVGVACAWRARRKRRAWDGAALALVLASLPTLGPAPHACRVALWPGRPTFLRRRLTLAASSQASLPEDCLSIGIVGAHAAQCALWCAGQIAAQAGGARVWWLCASPVLLGHAGVDIHVSDRDSCPHCTGTENSQRLVFHVGYASSVAALPGWCAQVCLTDDQPVSERWWWTVTRSDERDTLPTRLDWEPSPPGPTIGTLLVRIGQSHLGPVDLDLVNDGPHALVAGCTGSGKSEALLGWLASIADRYPPDSVRFVLIDYKGGATFSRLEGLPHTQALLTDLDAGATTRALEGIASVLTRREKRLSELGLPDLASWERAHTHDPHCVPSPAPRLIVAIDEFRFLAQTHPSSMDILMRLAAQGRSLGLHLIAATQRPAGAVSATMRANMDIRLALRCLNGPDSTDILGDASAAELPRIPGRAILSGVGTIQLSYLCDVARVVDRCARTWPRSQSRDLWAPPLPDTLTWEDVDRCASRAQARSRATPSEASDAASPLAVGIVEGIDTHSPLLWDGGSIQIQTSAHEASLASSWVASIASRLARRTGVPLHVISDSPVPGARTLLRPGDPGVIDLLEGACEHGPAILAIADAPELRSFLAQALPTPQAEALWAGVLGRARRSGITIVAAFSGRFTSASAALSAFSLRLVRARDADEALHAGIAPSDLRRLGHHHALALRPGEPALLACVPRDISPSADQPGQECPTGERPLVGIRPWRIPSPQEASDLVRNAPSPVLLGPTCEPPEWSQPMPWIVIGTTAHVRVVEAIHAFLGWEDPIICEVVSEQAWPSIARWDNRRVLALDPSHNVIRALIQNSRRHPLSLGAHRWGPSCGVISEGGILTTVKLTGGSVNT